MDRRGSCADLVKKGSCWYADAISSRKLNIVCEILKTCLLWFCATLYYSVLVLTEKTLIYFLYLSTFCLLSGPGHCFKTAVSVADRAGPDAGSADLPGDFEQVGGHLISRNDS